MVQLERIIEVEFPGVSSLHKPQNFQWSIMGFIWELESQISSERRLSVDKEFLRWRVLGYYLQGYYTNGVESIQRRFKELSMGEIYEGKITIRLVATDEKIRAEIEDNGTGFYEGHPISPSDIMGSLFIRPIDSRKCIPEYTGHSGIHLTQIANFVDEYGGKYGFENKGKNNGAIFWYELPLEVAIMNGCGIRPSLSSVISVRKYST